LKVEALVNVDLSPATFVGLLLICSGAALYQVRTVRPQIARDYDIFFSSIAMLCGGILCFQGWRLDPLLLFGEMLTVSAAIAFGVEAVNLRKENEPQRPWEEPGAEQRARRGRSSYSLPPSTRDAFDQWESATSSRPADADAFYDVDGEYDVRSNRSIDRFDRSRSGGPRWQERADEVYDYEDGSVYSSFSEGSQPASWGGAAYGSDGPGERVSAGTGVETYERGAGPPQGGSFRDAFDEGWQQTDRSGSADRRGEAEGRPRDPPQAGPRGGRGGGRPVPPPANVLDVDDWE